LEQIILVASTTVGINCRISNLKNSERKKDVDATPAILSDGHHAAPHNSGRHRASTVCLITLYTCRYTTDFNPHEYGKMAKERADKTLHDSATIFHQYLFNNRYGRL
jgi:hypothetical protein